MEVAKKHFLAAEKSVLDCEKNLTTLANFEENVCFVQSVGKNRWLISSKEKPAIQIGVVIDATSGIVTRMNWRQVFE